MVPAAPSHCSARTAVPVTLSAIRCLSCSCPSHAQVARHDQDLYTVDSKQMICAISGARCPCARAWEAGAKPAVPSACPARLRLRKPRWPALPSRAQPHTHSSTSIARHTHSLNAHSPLSSSPCSRSGLCFMAKQQEPLNALRLALAQHTQLRPPLNSLVW